MDFSIGWKDTIGEWASQSRLSPEKNRQAEEQKTEPQGALFWRGPDRVGQQQNGQAAKGQRQERRASPDFR
jgi:hypothetical protein